MDFKKSVVYQIYPRSFMDSNQDGIGDLQGIIQKLDYIKNLGVDIIWLSPIYKSPDKDNGYDISDYYDISYKFGTLADFNELLAKAHEKGLKIVMDLVVNHTSDQHPWFQESKSSKTNPKRDYYIWRDGCGDKAPTTQFGFFNESVWEYDQTTDQYYMHNFAVQQPDLNWENEEVRKAVYKMMNYWLEMGVDGFRMDVISLLSKPEEALRNDGGPGKSCANGPRIHEFLQEMKRETFAKYGSFTVGETAEVTLEEAAKYGNAEGTELDMVFHFELVSAADDATLGKWQTKKVAMKDFKEITNRWQKGLFNKAWNSLYLSNHDQPRQVSRFGNTDTKHNWEKSAKMLATVMHLQQGTPYVYQGEELGMTNFKITSLNDCDDYEVFSSYKNLVENKKLTTHDDFIAALNERCRDHARTPMQWNAGANAGFTTATPWLKVNPNYTEINAEAQVNDQNSIYNYYKKLIALRKEVECIVDGDFNLVLPENDDIFAFTRQNKDSKITVVANFTSKTMAMPLALEGALLIGNYNDASKELRPYEVLVYLQK